MRAQIGRRPGFATRRRGLRGMGDEESLAGNSAAIDCINAQQHIFVNGTVSDYLKELIYDPGGNALNDSQKQWAWSQWQALQDQISNTLTPQNTSACKASIDYTQKRGYWGNDPITNILSGPYQNQLMVDGSGYTLAQMIGIGKQAIDFHLFGSSLFGPDVQGTAPAGIIQYVDIPTHTLQTFTVGVNTGLSPAQMSSPSLTPDQQRLYAAGANAQQLAANNPGTQGPPNVSVPVPAALADNGQIVPASYSSPTGSQLTTAGTPIPATPAAIAGSINSTFANIPTSEWLTGAALVAIPFVLRGLSGLGDLQAEVTSYAQSIAFHTAHDAFLRQMRASSGLNQAQSAYLDSLISYIQDPSIRGARFATYPADMQAIANQAVASDALAPSLSPTYTDGHADPLSKVIADDQQSILNVLDAYAGTTGQNFYNQVHAQQTAYDTSENAIAGSISQAVGSGGNFILPGSGPIPAQYLPQNLPAEPAHPTMPAAANNPVLSLPPGGYNLQSPNPTAPTAPGGAANPIDTGLLPTANSLSSWLSNPWVWLGAGGVAFFANSGSSKRR